MNNDISTPEALLLSLQWRYATKVFDTSKKIPADTWDAIEQSLVLTPSSFGLQPWKFITITNQEIQSELLPHSWNQPQITDCSHLVVLCAKTKVSNEDIDIWLDHLAEARNVSRESLDGYAGMMRGYLGQMDATSSLSWAQNQVYIALGQLMTSAAILGIDACPMEGIIPAEYDRILGLETGPYQTTVACAMGFRSPDDKYATTPKVRFSREEIVNPV